MKTFYSIICLLLFTVSQQVVYAQQVPVAESKKESVEGFVKLGMPLEEALTKITFMYPSLKSGDLIGAIVFEGEGVTREKDYIRLKKPIKQRWTEKVYNSYYTLLSKYAVEGDRYIFVPLGMNGGGSGTFWNLNVVDKKTLRTVEEVGLGDRSRIEEIALADAHSDTVTITYIRREIIKGSPTHDPKKAIKKHFRMIEGTLREVGNPLSPSDPDTMFIPAGEFEMGSDDNRCGR